MDQVLTKEEFWVRYRAVSDDIAAREALHHEYHIQFATASTRRIVRDWIGTERIIASQDKWFNDIPLREWDRMLGSIKISIDTKKLSKAEPCGPHKFMWSPSLGTSIAKACAREIRDEARK